jgi:hypothetical protein
MGNFSEIQASSAIQNNQMLVGLCASRPIRLLVARLLRLARQLQNPGNRLCNQNGICRTPGN